MFGKKKEPVTSQRPGTASGGDSTRILALLAQDYLKEKKSRRRWGIAIKLLVLAYVTFVTFLYFSSGDYRVTTRHTAIVDIDGLIGAYPHSAEQVNQSLRDAFESEGSAGVVLRINSPGGTPVQAAQINEEIHRLKNLYPGKPVYAAVTDICTSGGYYIAVAAEQIFAHPSSIVGSIGVLMDGFGFVGTMEKLGIDRRLITAGDNKRILDPFSPTREADIAHAREMLSEVHRQFIAAVKAGRGDRLGDQPEIFSGLFWSGQKAKDLGLIDQFGSADTIAREVIGAELLVDYTYKPRFLESFADQVGVAISNTLLNHVLTIR